MPNPSIHWYQVTGVNGGDDLSRLNLSNGPVATEIGLTPGDDPWEWGNMEAGVWSVPVCLALQLRGDTAYELAVRMHDYVSNVENTTESFFGSGQPNGDGSGPPWVTDWDIRMAVLDRYEDFGGQEAATRNATIQSWDYIHRGASIAGWDLDSQIAAGTYGNQTDNPVVVNGRNLLIPHDTQPDTWMFNAFIFLAAKPEPNAIGGRHTGFGLTWSYLYPAPEVPDT
ncbi:MAG: hypothetical protein AAGD32_17600 [Planctomycetota bacterium]